MGKEQIAIGAAGTRLQRVLNHPLITMPIAVVIYLAAAVVGVALGNFVSVGQPGTGILQTTINVGLLLSAYKLLIVHLGRRCRDDLPAAEALPNLGKGLATGALLFSAVVGVAALLGVYRVAGADRWPELILPIFVTGIGPGFMEELLFRGILFRWIEEWSGSWIALLLSSALFGLVHILNPGATWLASLFIALEAGLLLGGAYMLTRSLWMPIGLHAAWNIMQGAVYGVPVSGLPAQGIIEARLAGPKILTGGSFGLEASIIALVIAAAAGAWFVWLAVRRGELVQPSWVRFSKGH